MEPVFTVAQIRQLETQWAFERDSESAWSLMVAASTSFVRQFLVAFQSERVLIVAGNGNNGGDGYYIGKLLIESGIKVTVWAPMGLPNAEIDAFKAHSHYVGAGGKIVSDLSSYACTIIVDALLGIGLSRPLSGDLLACVQTINRLNCPVYAVDIPSGLNAETGVSMPESIVATATHSFIGLKPGLLTHTGPSVCGRLTVDRLGIDSSSLWGYHSAVSHLPNRQGNTHKAEQGNVSVVGGMASMAGAAIIAARAALNAGAGRVFLHCNPQFFPAALTIAPELITANHIPIEKNELPTVFVIGPGLGQEEPVLNLWRTIVDGQRGGVMDADALRLLAESPQATPQWILTPHEGEAAALLGVSSEAIQKNRPRAALALAEKYQSTIILKGSGTLVATQGQLTFCHAGSPVMATPGMGDCLAGLVAALMAQGLSSHQAAVTGVNWHANLGAMLAQTQRIVLASDIIDQLKNTPVYEGVSL